MQRESVRADHAGRGGAEWRAGGGGGGPRIRGPLRRGRRRSPGVEGFGEGAARGSRGVEGDSPEEAAGRV